LPFALPSPFRISVRCSRDVAGFLPFKPIAAASFPINILGIYEFGEYERALEGQGLEPKIGSKPSTIPKFLSGGACTSQARQFQVRLLLGMWPWALTR
jgi:hypothetical protein